MLKCREVPQEIEGMHDGQLGWRRQIALRLHLLICHHCRRYVRQLGVMLRALHQQPCTEKLEDRHVQQIVDRLPQKAQDK